MRRSSIRRRLRFLLLALLALNGVVALAWTIPRALQERGVLDRSDALRRDVERQRRRLGELRERQRVIRANAEDARRLLGEHLAPRSTGLLPLLEEIEAAARQAGLRVRSRSYGQDLLEGVPVVRVGINLPAEGSYRQLVRFIELLEGSERFLALDQLRLSDREGGRDQLALVISAYFRDDAGEASHGA